MKKRVRVYQKGGFNAFDAPVMPPLRVAQQGTNVQQPQYTDEQLLSVVMSIVGEQGGSPEDAMQQLVSAGVDQNKANQVVSSAIEYINQQRGQGQQAQQQQGPSQEEIAQAEAEAEAQAQAEEEADRRRRYNAEMANDQADLDDSEGDIDAFAAEYILRNGGALPSKRSFVKNVMKLTKKAAGGAADDTDIPDGRQAGLQAFVGNLKGKANGYLQEQDAKAMYEMMAPLANESDIYGEEPHMQFGGMRPGQQRRLERRANRMAGMIPAGFFNAQQQMFPQGINIMSMPGMMPGMGLMGPKAFQMPARGLYAGGPRLANIEVHKTGLFGRPKQWTATFDNSGYYDPNQWMRDMARMNQANQQTEYEDADFDHSEEATNTSTAENAEVAKSQAETQTGGGDGTKPKPSTGDDVKDEVEQSKKPAGDIPDIDIYDPWKQGMTDVFNSKGNEYYGKEIKVDGKSEFKRWSYNPKTKQWFREGSTKALDDKEAIAKLNNWRNNFRSNAADVNNATWASEMASGFMPDKPQRESFSMKLSSFDEKVKPMKIDLKSNPVTGLNPGNPDDIGAQLFGYAVAGNTNLANLYNLGRMAEQLPPGNNQGLSGPGVPSSVRQVLGQGPNPRLLGTGPGVEAVPQIGGSSGIFKYPNLTQNGTFNDEAKQVEKSKPVKLDLTKGETAFQLKSGDTKSWYVSKNGKLYKAPKLSTQTAGQEQWYEIKDPQRIQNIIAMSGLNPQAFRQFGGMTDQQSELYRFMGGGEDISVPTLNEKNTADPYFAEGGYLPRADMGYRVITDKSGKTKIVNIDEQNTWDNALKDNPDLSLDDVSFKTDSPYKGDFNHFAWEDLINKGVKVGDYREGIDYTQLDKFPKTTNSGKYPTGWGTYTNVPGYGDGVSMYGNYPMYNPMIGAMYPPLFGGGRRFSPPGRMFEYAGSWAKQKGMPFDPRTGQILGQMPTDLPLTKLDVTRSSLIGSRPKRWTATFGNYGQLGDNLPKGTPGTEGAAAAPEGQVNDRRNRFAERLMHTPGLRKLGAKLYEQPNLPLPEGTQYTQEQMPSLPLRGTNSALASDLVPDQYNKRNQGVLPGVDLTGLPDVAIPEVTPEQFSFADQQRFGNVQGPLNQEEATGMGSLPMRPLSSVPNQLASDIVPSNFNYPGAAELQRFIPQPEGPMTQEDYADQLGFPTSQPDLETPVSAPAANYPYNVAGPASDFANDPQQDEYWWNENQSLPTSESTNYYQDVMQPYRDQRIYNPFTDQYITPEESMNQVQENLDSFPMTVPDSSLPEALIDPNMIQSRMDAVDAMRQVQANGQRELQRRDAEIRRREREAQAAFENQRRNDGREERQVQRTERRNQRTTPAPTYTPPVNPQASYRTPEQERAVREAQLEQQDFQRRYGADELAIELYETLLAAPKANKTQIEAMLKQYPGLRNYKKGTLSRDRQVEERIKNTNRGQQNPNGVRLPSWMRQMGGPAAQTGLFTTNPDLVGFSDLDLINAQTAPEVSGMVNNATGNWWSASPNMPTIQETGMVQPEEMMIDPNQPNNQTIKRQYDPRGAAVKFKNKDMYNVDFTRMADKSLSFLNQGLGMLGERGNRDRLAQMANNRYSDGIYGSTRLQNRGTYETNSGLFRPDEEGFKGIVRDGGAIYKTGGVTYMSADQVKKFLAEGGELEFV